METRTVILVDQARKVVATAQVADEGRYYGGSIDLRETPPSLLALFREFEEIVNGQMFAFLDDIQERIGAVPIKAMFDSGQEAYVRDLQVFPSTSDISFRLVKVPIPNRKLV